MTTPAPKKKRVTIAQLEKQIVELHITVGRHKELYDEERETTQNLRAESRAANLLRERATEAQHKAERSLHELRQAVLEYFQIMANAQTAGDKKRIERVQGMISGYMTAFEEPSRAMGMSDESRFR